MKFEILIILFLFDLLIYLRKHMLIKQYSSEKKIVVHLKKDKSNMYFFKMIFIHFIYTNRECNDTLICLFKWALIFSEISMFIFSMWFTFWKISKQEVCEPMHTSNTPDLMWIFTLMWINTNFLTITWFFLDSQCPK